MLPHAEVIYVDILFKKDNIVLSTKSQVDVIINEILYVYKDSGSTNIILDFTYIKSIEKNVVYELFVNFKRVYPYINLYADGNNDIENIYEQIN